MTAEQCVDFRRSYITITSGSEKVNVVDISGGYRPSDKGRSPKKFFSAVRDSFWLKKKGAPGPPLDLPLGNFSNDDGDGDGK